MTFHQIRRSALILVSLVMISATRLFGDSRESAGIPDTSTKNDLSVEEVVDRWIAESIKVHQVEFSGRLIQYDLDVENKAGSVTAEQLHEAILVAQQMFISDVIDNQTWLERVG